MENLNYDYSGNNTMHVDNEKNNREIDKNNEERLDRQDRLDNNIIPNVSANNFLNTQIDNSNNGVEVLHKYINDNYNNYNNEDDDVDTRKVDNEIIMTFNNKNSNYKQNAKANIIDASSSSYYAKTQHINNNDYFNKNKLLSSNYLVNNVDNDNYVNDKLQINMIKEDSVNNDKINYNNINNSTYYSKTEANLNEIHKSNYSISKYTSKDINKHNSKDVTNHIYYNTNEGMKPNTSRYNKIKTKALIKDIEDNLNKEIKLNYNYHDNKERTRNNSNMKYYSSEKRKENYNNNNDRNDSTSNPRNDNNNNMNNIFIYKDMEKDDKENYIGNSKTQKINIDSNDKFNNTTDNINKQQSVDRNNYEEIIIEQSNDIGQEYINNNVKEQTVINNDNEKDITDRNYKNTMNMINANNDNIASNINNNTNVVNYQEYFQRARDELKKNIDKISKDKRKYSYKSTYSERNYNKSEIESKNKYNFNTLINSRFHTSQKNIDKDKDNFNNNENNKVLTKNYSNQTLNFNYNYNKTSNSNSKSKLKNNYYANNSHYNYDYSQISKRSISKRSNNNNNNENSRISNNTIRNNFNIYNKKVLTDSKYIISNNHQINKNHKENDNSQSNSLINQYMTRIQELEEKNIQLKLSILKLSEENVLYKQFEKELIETVLYFKESSSNDSIQQEFDFDNVNKRLSNLKDDILYIIKEDLLLKDLLKKKNTEPINKNNNNFNNNINNKYNNQNSSNSNYLNLQQAHNSMTKISEEFIAKTWNLYCTMENKLISEHVSFNTNKNNNNHTDIKNDILLSNVNFKELWGWVKSLIKIRNKIEHEYQERYINNPLVSYVYGVMEKKKMKDVNQFIQWLNALLKKEYF